MNNQFANLITNSKFNTYRGLGNTCPVCASTSGKCKWQSYDLTAKNGKTTPTTKTLCMTGAGGYGNPDYHYFSDTRDGLWGIYIPLADWNSHRGENFQATPEQREQWVTDQQLKTEALLAAENQRRAESLSALERDIVARDIVTQLSLNSIDRKDLVRRGFTQQQIREIGFVSVEKWQKIKVAVNNRFPGVNIQGTKLNNGITGILIPLYTVTGEIVAFQIRNREKSEKGRYRWLSSTWEQGRDNGSAPSLPNGENPLAFAYPQLLGVEPTSNSTGSRQRFAIGLAEGTGAKPNLAAILTGQQIIGAAGGQWLSSPKLLKDGLERWRAEDIDLYLDGEDPHKPQVIRRWVNLYHQLLEWGYKPRLMYSGHDIDELEDLSLLRSLSLDELEHLAGGAIEVEPPAPISLARQLYHRSKRFTPTETQCERYLNWAIPETGLQNTLVGIRSPLGTGKTELLKSAGAWATAKELELLFLGYRNNLLRQTCDRIPDLYHVVDEDRIMLSSDSHKALCHHSAALIDPAEMGNKILVLDECVSNLIDMLTSRLTAGRNKDGSDSRQVRLAHIEELIKNCYGVICLDGYLSDTELDFLQDLRQFNGVYKIENTYCNQMAVRVVNQKSTVRRAIIDDALAGSNLLITATAQNQCENLEKALIKVGIPKSTICRIDSTTDWDESIQLFFKSPKAYLEKYRPQIVILSPTAESGISIDLPSYFQTHYHFHLGNLGILSGLQFLGRYRDFTAPRVIFCEKQGRIAEYNSSSFSKSVKDEFDRQVMQDMDLVFALLDKGMADEAMAILKTYAAKDDPWLKLAHQYKANLNHELQNLRELFIEAMRGDGYTVTVDSEDIEGCDDTNDLFGRVEVERRVTQSRRIYNAPDINRAQYEQIRHNASANEVERLLANKHRLTQQQLPGIMETQSYSPELIQMVKYNHPALIEQLELYFYLLHPELAEVNHLANWLPVIEKNPPWLPDQLDRSSLALVKVGRELGLHDLAGQGFNSARIEAIVQQVFDSRLLQSSLRININPVKLPAPNRLFKRIVKKFGFKLVQLKNSEFEFELQPMADSILSFKGAPRYELLTPELTQSVAALSGSELHKDDLVIQSLGKAMEELGMSEGRGRMCLVAGAARHLGLTVVSHRQRRTVGGQLYLARVYRFSGMESAPDPISGAIAGSQLYPGTHPVQVQHIYECLSKRLERLAVHQHDRIHEWKESKTLLQKELAPTIHIDNFATILEINVLNHQCGLSEFMAENIRSVAETLLAIGQMEPIDFELGLEEYLSVTNLEVARLALELVRLKYPIIAERMTIPV